MLRRHWASGLLLWLYRIRRFRWISMRTAYWLEGGEFYTATVRLMMERYHGVRVGAYSYGDCMRPGIFPRGVEVGRYVSVAAGVRVFRRNHPADRLSMHPFFFNQHAGLLAVDNVGDAPLEIGNDAWIGYGAIITPRCRRIGHGAVVGAGAVVTSDVDDFAIVAGNPAKLIRYRFDESLRRAVLESRWWDLPVEQCAPVLAAMVEKLDHSHPLLAGHQAPRTRPEERNTPCNP